MVASDGQPGIKPMSQERRGEIALLLFRQKMLKDGFMISGNSHRDVANAAKAVGISVEEAMEFTETLVRELIAAAFTKSAKTKD